jgi:biotin carboxyl carrier protein
VQIEGVDGPVEVRRLDRERYAVTIGERRFTVIVASSPAADWGWVDGQTFRWPHRAETDDTTTIAAAVASGSAGSDNIASTMPATVSQVSVTVGQRVSRGETLVMLEAMKMEIPLRAPRDARVAAIHCAEGDTVEPGVTLVDLTG